MSFAFIPFYVERLGASGYAVIGLAALMQAGLSIFDNGLHSLMSRKMSGYVGRSLSLHSLSLYLRSSELLMLLAACLWAVLFVFPMKSIFWSWSHASFVDQSGLGSGWVSSALIALLLVFNSINNFYKSCLAGLQCQVELNSVLAIVATLKSVGCAVVLNWRPDIDLYFAWQILSMAVSILSLIFICYVRLGLDFARIKPASFKTVFDHHDVKFGGSLILTAAASFFILQADKISVASLLSQSDFGYYSFVSTMAAGIAYAVMPIVNVVYPRLCQYSFSGNRKQFKALFHRASTLIGCLIFAVLMSVTVFAFPLYQVSIQAQSLMSQQFLDAFLVLLVGNSILYMQMLPVYARYAEGSTKYWLNYSLLSAVVYVPVQLYATFRFATDGAAWSWLIYALIGLVFAVPRLFVGILSGELKQWISKDLMLPFILSAFPVGVIYLLYNSSLLVKSFSLCVAAFGGSVASSAFISYVVVQFASRRRHIVNY